MKTRTRSQGSVVVGRPRSAPDTPSTDSGRIQVPSLNLDPIQSMRPWPVVVTLGGQELEIPALPAVDWLAILMAADPQLDDVFPGLLSAEDADWVEEEILDGNLTLTDFQELLFQVIETASARRWWVTMRLVDVARRSWDVIGSEMLLRGVDAAVVSLSAWLDVLLITVLKNMDPKEVTMFTMRLEAAPDQEQEPEEMEMSRSAFMALGGE